MEPEGNIGKIAEEFDWVIPRFISLPTKPDEYEDSHTFSFAGESWYMSIYPMGITKFNKVGHIGLYLKKCRSLKSINLEYTFSLRTLEGVKFQEERFRDNFTNANERHGICSYITRQQLFKNKSELLPDDTLTVVCTMKYSKPMENDDNATTIQRSETTSLTTPENSPQITSRKCPKCSAVVNSGKLDNHKCLLARAVKDETINIQHPETTNLTTQEKSLQIIYRKCPKCSAVFDLRKLHDHKCLEEKVEDETISIQRLENTSMTAQETSPMITSRKCSKCSAVVDSGKLDDHKCPVARAKDKTIAIPCCKTTSPARQENSPLITSRKCPKCSAVVDSGKLNDHKCLIARAEAIEKLLRDLKRLLVTGDHSDTKLRVQMEEFRLHKCILSARNPSFELMFKKELRERTADTVYITDCEPGPFHTLIHYIYTGTADKISPEDVCNLYEIADRYQEEQLKAECLQFMMNSISVDNFCDIIALALKDNEQHLLKAAKEFFPCKAKEIIRSVKWKSFTKNYPEQADELFMDALNCDNK